MDMDLDKFNYERQGQISMFDLTMEQIKIDKPIRMIETFAGYGSQSMALKAIGANFEHYKMIEFDKYAVASYNAVHGTCFEPSDIRDIRGKDLEILYTDLFTYLLTYSFPCTDLSVAGKMQGMSKGSGTRSGLLWEVERLLTEIHDDGGELPQILFMENVPQVLSSANIKDFHAWQDFLTGLGYTNHVQVLNAKDYGVAQNRERAFMFSLLGEFNYKFPEPIPLTKTMKDYMEDEVDEKYYINTEKAQKLIKTLIANCQIAQKSEVGLSVIGSLNPEKECQDRVRVFGTDGISPGLRATDYKSPTKICVDLSIKNPSENNVANCITSRENRGISNQQSVGNGVIVAMRGRNPQNPSDRTTGAPTEQRLEPNSQGLCNTITSVQKDNMVLENRFYEQAIKVFQNNDCKEGDTIDAFNEKVNKTGVSPTITTRPEGLKTAILPVVRAESLYRIRKLTPRECFRLMGVNEADIKKMMSVNSNSQCYKQAGNSIVVNCMIAMFSNLNIQGLPRWDGIKHKYFNPPYRA